MVMSNRSKNFTWRFRIRRSRWPRFRWLISRLYRCQSRTMPSWTNVTSRRQHTNWWTPSRPSALHISATRASRRNWYSSLQKSGGGGLIIESSNVIMGAHCSTGYKTNKKAVLSQGEPLYYRILQRHCAVSLQQHAFLLFFCLQTAVNVKKW